VADARAGGGQREMRAFRAMGDAARLDHMAEQAQVGQVEAHVGIPILRNPRRQALPIAHGFEPFQGIFFVLREVKR
jgi:hypothetical protein